ncbi:MAG TPA: hypothetical protein VF530_09490, partial [Planctomycetota bacterium]
MLRLAPLPSRGLIRLVPLASLLLLGQAPAGAQGLRVNGPFVRAPQTLSYVHEFCVAPGGTRVAFLANLDGGLGRWELFAAPVAEPAAYVRLSTPGASCAGPLVIGAGRVVYQEWPPGGAAGELRSVPLDGSAPSVRLSPDLGSARLYTPRLSASLQRVLFLAHSSTDRLWSAPLDGSAPAVQLGLPFVASGGVREWALTADGRTVVFSADRVTAGLVELWRAPADGSAGAVRLSGGLPVAADEGEDFALSADGSRVAFTTAWSGAGIGLYGAPLDASAAPVRLDDDEAVLSTGHAFRLTADGSTVIHESELAGSWGNVLWSVPAAGGTAVRLGAHAPGTGTFELTPDGARVVYLSSHAGNRPELYSAFLDGSPAVRLTEPRPSGSTTAPLPFVTTADSRRVLYLLDQEQSGVRELWSVPLDHAQPPVRLNGPLGANSDVTHFALAGARVVYRADEEHDERFELYAAPVSGAAPRTRTSGPLELHGDVTEFAPTRAGLRVLYLADAGPDGTFTLWSAPTAGGGAAIELSMPFEPGPVVGGVGEFAWAAGGTRLLYGAIDSLAYLAPRKGVFSADLTVRDPEGRFPVEHLGSGAGLTLGPGGVRCAFSLVDPWCDVPPCDVTLFTTRTDGSEAFVALREEPEAVGPVRFSPDGLHTAFLWHHPYVYPATQVLHLGPSDGSAPELAVSGPGATFVEFEFSPDGAYLVYTERSAERDHLYCVPVDLSAPPRALNPAFFDPLQDVRAFRLTRDGRVVFLADPVVPEAFELWIAPLDGSAAAMRLGPPGDPLAQIEPDFRITSDDAHAVYVVERELWSVALGSGAAVRLSAVGTSGSGLVAPLAGRSQLELAPDGTRAVYLAGQDALGVRELFVVPVAGGVPPVRLHPALGPQRGIEPSGFAVSADSAWAVFAADLAGDGVLSLHSAPLSGGSQPLELAGPFVSGGELFVDFVAGIRATFALTPDARSAVYLADQEEDERVELYTAPLDGSGPARRLNRTLPPGGDVSSFALQPAGRWVAYRSDQDMDECFELFVSLLDAGRWLPADPPRPLRLAPAARALGRRPPRPVQPDAAAGRARAATGGASGAVPRAARARAAERPG